MTKKLRSFIILILAFALPGQLIACTIFCVKDDHGHMWAGNNEDFYWFYFSTQIRVVPKTDTSLSFVYFRYENHNFPQGGVNEAGLFYDANMVEASQPGADDKRSPFTGNTQDLMLFILGNLRTVPEAIQFFQKYRVPDLNTGQIHLADSSGNKGIVTSENSWVSTDNFQVSTNYNLSHKDNDYKNCWRFPIAHSMLSGGVAGIELMTQICDSTSQRKGASTIYSNVHNLNTGDMWLYYGWDYEKPYKTNFNELISLGDTVVMMRDLFPEQILVKAYNTFKTSGFAEAVKTFNEIADPAERKEKLKLLSSAALFDFDAFASGKITMINNDKLIVEVIQATEDEEILSMIGKLAPTEANKELAAGKLRKLNRSNKNPDFILMFSLIGAVVLALLIGLNKVKKQKLT
jgi:hypothetical protein